MAEQVLSSAHALEQALGGGVYRKVLAYQDALMLAEVRFETGAVGGVHTHPHAQSSYVLSGAFDFEIDGAHHIVRAGDTLAFLPGQPHGCVCLEAGTLLDAFTPLRKDFL